VADKHERSRKIFEASRRLMPGGVNSPVRAFQAVGGDPVVFAYGKGARLFVLADGQVVFLETKKIRPARDALPDANLTVHGLKGRDLAP